MMQDVDLHNAKHLARADEHAYRVTSNNKRRLYLYSTIVCLVVVIAIAVIVGVMVGGGSNSASTEDQTDLMTQLQSTFEREGLPSDALTTENSYQNKAFLWLADNDQLESYDHTQRMQRFALACLYHATNQVATFYTPNPQPWVHQNNWLTNANECDWDGVICNSKQRVKGINLEGNNMSGELPVELVLMKEHFVELDLTSNLIYMEGPQLDLFAKLFKLKTLLMDDNYLSSEDGLPTSLGELSRLEKLRLSYNLLEGPMDGGILQRMTQLSHLEIESNFLTGSLPLELGNMPELVYVYLRRNSFDSTLDFLKEGNSPNLFTLWLDSNPQIRGTIPTEIGLYTDLASLSLTNCTLTGTLPSEIGLLTGLRRMWLYENRLGGTIPEEVSQLSILEVVEVQENQFVGSIPEGVCSIIEASTYERKSVEADCNEVSCSCCTFCHT